jgi:hypothetical protein
VGPVGHELGGDGVRATIAAQLAGSAEVATQSVLVILTDPLGQPQSY